MAVSKWWAYETLQCFLNIFGKERIETAIGNIGVVFLLAFLSTSAYVGIDLLGLSPLDAEDERALLLYALIFIAVPFSIAAFLGSILDSYEYSHCEECKRDLACERVGEPLVEEIEEKGVIKLVTTEKYECRFCGHIRYKVNKSDKYHDTMPV